MAREGSNELGTQQTAKASLSFTGFFRSATTRPVRPRAPRNAATWLAGKPVRALVLGAATFGIVGCGSSSNSPTTSQSAAAPATQTQASTASTQSKTAAGTTPPGTALAVGGTATVPYLPPAENPSSKPGFQLQVTVSAIEKGSLSDFNGIKLDSTEKASTPFYVKVKLTNVGGGDPGKGDNPTAAIEGVDNTGETQESVTFLLGGFPRCEDKEPPKPFSHGKSFESCLVFLVPGGITKAAYSSTEEYLLKPVTWK
jgi:hypothetical protein